MSFTTFKTYWFEVSPRVAQQLAIANGVTHAQAQLWAFHISQQS
jgi:hypothetical protein